MSGRDPAGDGGDPGSGQTLARKERLRRRREFLAIQGSGKKIHLEHLLVMVRAGASGRRFGLTVSAKVGPAVERNRIKRLLREVWRRDRAQLPDGIEIVFIAKRNAASTTYQSLRRQFAELARRLAHPGRT